MDEYKKKISITAGNNIRVARRSSGIKAKDFAEKIHVTHQQLVKYEKGQNEIPFYRMCYIADALSKDISYFRNDTELLIDPNEAICVKLMYNFTKIKSKHAQEAILSIVKELAEKE